MELGHNNTQYFFVDKTRIFIMHPRNHLSLVRLEICFDFCRSTSEFDQLWILRPDPPLYPLHSSLLFLFQSLSSSMMPYLRPDRKGLPDPLSEDGENSVEMPRSESYLHLSDLADASTSSQVGVVGPSQSVSQLIDSEPVPRESKKVRVVTPPDDTSEEHSPAKPSPPSSPSPGNMEKLRAVDSPKSPSRRSSKFNSPLSPSAQGVSYEYPHQIKENGGQSPERKSYQTPKADSWTVISFFVPAYKKDKGKETMVEVSKRLTEQNLQKDVDFETTERQSKPNVSIASASGLPLKSAKPSKASLEKKSSPQSPILSPKSPSSSPNLDATSPQLPKKLPRPAKKPIEQKEMVEIPVEMKPRSLPLVSLTKSQTEGDVDSPAPPSTNTSENSSKSAIEPLVIMPVTLSNPPSPVASPGIPKEKSKVNNKPGEPKVGAKSEITPQSPARRSSTIPSKRIVKKEVITDTSQRDPIPQSTRSVPAPAPAVVGTSLLYLNSSQHVQGDIQGQ